MSLGPTLLRPFNGPHRTGIKTTWQHALGAAPGLCPNEATDLQATLDAKVPA
jgi:hypothetical protein